MKTSLIIFSMFILISVQGVAQESNKVVRKVNFKQFEPYLHRQTDTLYVINFWATWCTPCREELPAFLKAYDKYSGQKLKMLLVSLDFPNQMNSRLIPFIKTNKIKPEVILLDDPKQNEWIDKVDPNWSGALPFTVIYNSGFRKTYEQQFTFAKLDSIIQRNIIKP